MFLVAALLFVISTVAAPAAHGYWTIGPSLAAPESGGLTAPLTGGRMLLAGGEAADNGDPVRTTQVFNPRTGSWSLVSPMRVARVGGTATGLKDGRVLVVGGLGSKLHPLRAAEIFEPMNDTWTPVQPLPQTRFSHSASLLADGRVLVVGGIVDGGISRSVVLFNPHTLKWEVGASTIGLHAEQSSVPLTDGRILIIGGFGGPPEEYNQLTGRWLPSQATPSRSHAVVLRLRDGTVLLAAGTGTHHHDLHSVRILDPSSGAWSYAGRMRKARNQAVGSVLPDGRAIVAGGEQVTGHVLRSAELYDPTTRRWSATGGMLATRDAAATTSMPDGGLLVCGGMNFSGVLQSCEIYHP